MHPEDSMQGAGGDHDEHPTRSAKGSQGKSSQIKGKGKGKGQGKKGKSYSANPNNGGGNGGGNGGDHGGGDGNDGASGGHGGSWNSNDSSNGGYGGGTGGGNNGNDGSWKSNDTNNSGGWGNQNNAGKTNEQDPNGDDPFTWRSATLDGSEVWLPVPPKAYFTPGREGIFRQYPLNEFWSANTALMNNGGSITLYGLDTRLEGVDDLKGELVYDVRLKKKVSKFCYGPCNRECIIDTCEQINDAGLVPEMLVSDELKRKITFCSGCFTGDSGTCGGSHFYRPISALRALVKSDQFCELIRKTWLFQLKNPNENMREAISTIAKTSTTNKNYNPGKMQKFFSHHGRESVKDGLLEFQPGSLCRGMTFAKWNSIEQDSDNQRRGTQFKQKYERVSIGTFYPKCVFDRLVELDAFEGGQPPSDFKTNKPLRDILPGLFNGSITSKSEDNSEELWAYVRGFRPAQ
jgi:hypothetical protein